MHTSKLYRCNTRDFLHGLIVAMGTAAVAAIERAAAAWPIVLNYKQIALASLCAGIAYLGKRFFTPAQNITKP